jgi:hypothetical protein
MPHDKNGKEVVIGQEVIMRFKVTAVMQGTEYCNVNLESVEKLYPGNYPTLLSAVNTKQLEVIESEAPATIIQSSDSSAYLTTGVVSPEVVDAIVEAVIERKPTKKSKKDRK